PGDPYEQKFPRYERRTKQPTGTALGVPGFTASATVAEPLTVTTSLVMISFACIIVKYAPFYILNTTNWLI
ncbi:MAG: hypothetical protein AAF635_13155, partial [Cyanobacteria bacterium P01_C01_bin.69]